MTTLAARRCDLEGYISTATPVRPEKYKMSSSKVAGIPPSLQKTPSAPKLIWLSEDFLPGWRLASPIVLSVERDEDGEYIATDAFSTVYGNGKTVEKAANDYCTSLVDYYELLAEHKNVDGPSAVQFYRLSQHVYKVR